jgi:hypothetical protein
MDSSNRIEPESYPWAAVCQPVPHSLASCQTPRMQRIPNSATAVLRLPALRDHGRAEWAVLIAGMYDMHACIIVYRETKTLKQ